MRGHLYILSNPAIPNLLKIGYTKRTVVQRIEELMTTGVPGAFEVEFFAEVEHARQLERDIHRRLLAYRRDRRREFFECSLEIAVKTAKILMLEHGHTIFNSGGRASKAFLTDVEIEEIRQEAEKLSIERQKLDERRKQEDIARAIDWEKRAERLKLLIQQFFQLAPIVYETIDKKYREHWLLYRDV
jgi:hypothetical protein